MSIALGVFVTLRLIRGCALGPLEASALGGKMSSPYGEVGKVRGRERRSVSPLLIYNLTIACDTNADARSVCSN